MSLKILVPDGGESTASSPMIVHRFLPEEVSVKAFKRVLEGPTQRERDEEDARTKSIQEKFLHADFEELCSMVEQQGKSIAVENNFSSLSLLNLCNLF